MRLPVQLADASAPLASAALPDLSAAGLDAGIAAATVERAHGDAQVFAGALSAGVGHDPDARDDRDRALDLVAIAAWRAGALALRADALARLDGLGDAEARMAAAAILGIGVDRLDEFRRRQRTDRYWWPGRVDQRGYVLSVGGFRGIGGAWIRPPERAQRLREQGAFALLVADVWWRLDCDVWGAQLTPLPDAPDPGRAPDVDAARDDGVSIVIGPDTHLAWVHVRESQ